MHFLDIPGLTAKRMVAQPALPVTGLRRVPMWPVLDDYYPRWISEKDQLAEALIFIDGKTEVTQIRFNPWFSNEVELFDREVELVKYDRGQVVIAKRMLAQSLKDSLARKK